MVTAPTQPRSVVSRLPGRRYDHWFFTGMSLVMLATVFAGFAPSYFLAGMMRAHLASPILHVHGAAFTAWVVLLIVQSVLVASHRIKIHQWLGFGVFALGVFMVVLGTLAATDSMVRGAQAADLHRDDHADGRSDLPPSYALGARAAACGVPADVLLPSDPGGV